MPVSREDIESQFEFTKELMQDAQQDLAEGNVPTERVHLVYKQLARDASDLGVYSLALGRSEGASEWFDQSATYYIEGVERHRAERGTSTDPEENYWENEPQNLRDVLHSALLSRERTTLEDAAKLTLQTDESFVEEYSEPIPVSLYYYVKALAAIICDDEGQEAYLNRLEEASKELESGLASLFEARMTTLRGINDRDSDRTTRGLQGLVEHHDADVDSEPEVASEVVDLESCALLQLALEKEVDVSFESRYIPDSVRKPTR